jgi:hypothetical protein
MYATNSELERLLAPISPERFFREAWEKKSLMVHRGAGHYAGLFSLSDLDTVIAYTRPRFPDRAAFETSASKPATYVRGVLADRVVSPPDNPSLAELRQAYECGKSIVIMAMHHRWPAVAMMCRGLEAAFHCPVHANLYLTPAGAQGFAAHFDTHEVFVLQLEGVKNWRLYGAAQHLPLATDIMPLARRPGKAAEEVTLRAGDLLYIPRGHVHEAVTPDQPSLHLTVGINVYRWADLLHHAVTCLSRSEAGFRESLAGGALPDGMTHLKARFQLLVEKLTSAAADGLYEQALDSLGGQFFREMSMLPCGHFRGSGNCEEIGLDTVLERKPSTICRVLRNGQGVAIEFPGNRVAGPHRIEPALRFIAEQTRFTSRELPGELTGDARLVLVRRLVREGLLNVAATSASNEASGRTFFDGATISEENHVDDVKPRQSLQAVEYVGGSGVVGRGPEATTP